MRTSRSHLAWAAISLALVLSACGGGGSSPETPAVASTTISGYAVEGPVAGATVIAYALDGGMMGAQIGQATTGTDGSYSMTIPAASGPILLRMVGGTYVDEATGATVAMSAGQAMTAVMQPPVAATGNVMITPLTSMAQSMAAAMPGGMSAANIGTANAAVGSYFMVTDILHTMPMNPLSAGSSATATASMLNYGMTLAAMSQLARDMGISSNAMVGAMMTDASDGVLDGKAGATPITMGGMMSGGMMPAAAGSSGVSSAMVEFMNSGSNRSGATQATMAGLMQHLSTSGGVLH